MIHADLVCKECMLVCRKRLFIIRVKNIAWHWMWSEQNFRSGGKRTLARSKMCGSVNLVDAFTKGGETHFEWLVKGVGEEREGGKPLRGRALPYMVKKARIGWGCPALIGRSLGSGGLEQRLCSYNTLQAGCQLHSVFGARSVGCAAVSHPKTWAP